MLMVLWPWLLFRIWYRDPHRISKLRPLIIDVYQELCCGKPIWLGFPTLVWPMWFPRAGSSAWAGGHVPKRCSEVEYLMKYERSRFSVWIQTSQGCIFSRRYQLFAIEGYYVTPWWIHAPFISNSKVSKMIMFHPPSISDQIGHRHTPQD